MLLKWAGGKRQLLPELRRFYPRAHFRKGRASDASGACKAMAGTTFQV